MIAADGPSAAEVDSFSLRAADGQVLQFKVVRLDLTNSGLPSAHLREHMSSGEPITVYYHVENAVNIADRYTDAGPASTVEATGPPTPTTAPTNTPSPSPTALSTTTPSPGPTIALPVHLDTELFANGFQALTFLANAGDGSNDLYAVEQRGVVWRIGADGTGASEFLSITNEISCCNERGLLGLAFHPDYENNGRLFIDYTDVSGNTVVSELTLGVDGNVDPVSERKLLGIDQPFPNHNGGMLAFGADGYLYIGSGDGGSGGDPVGNGQSRATLLGKILRIDVDKGDPYSIPKDNPLVCPRGCVGGPKPEIWDWGMRNPWRFSFDRATGDLWVGDVGQDIYEEVDAEAAGDGGRNYGWNTMEAAHCYFTAPCNEEGLTLPVAEVRHKTSCAIIGGYVYRGSAYPLLVGQYVFTDLCSGNLWAIDAAQAMASGTVAVDPPQFGNANITPTGFGEDEAGELYIVNAGGEIYRLVVN